MLSNAIYLVQQFNPIDPMVTIHHLFLGGFGLNSRYRYTYGMMLRFI